MKFFLNLALVLCALTTISTKSAYEFTNEQVNCRFQENRTKLICNLSGNVECDVVVALPESLTSDETIDMLAVGFQESKDGNSLGDIDMKKIIFNLYPSNVNDKKLIKPAEPLLMLLDSEGKTESGIAIKDDKCYDKLIKLFKVVEMIKKTQLISLKDAGADEPTVLIYGEILLNNQ